MRQETTKHGGKLLHRMEFDGVQDFVSTLSQTKYVPHLTAFNSMFGNHLASSRWIGRQYPNGWKSVFEAANGQWEEGLATVTEMEEELTEMIPAPEARVRRRRWSDDGDDICLDRMRSGQDYWVRCQRVAIEAPQVVTLVTNISTPGTMDHRDILWRGAAAIAATVLLEQAGFRVELVCVDRTDRTYANGDGYMSALWLKRAGDMLDRASLVSAISGWFYRTMFFASTVIPATPNTPLWPTTGLGSCRSADQDDLAWLCPGPWHSLPDRCYSRQAAMQAVKTLLATINTQKEAA